MTQTWFEAKLKYNRVSESGYEQLVTEAFMLDAVSFTDAETRMTEKAQELTNGEFAVKDIKQSQIAEVLSFADGEWWFKCKINLVTINEESGNEKKTASYFLVEADNIDEASARLQESLSDMLVPYDVVTINRTNIADVFPYDLADGVAKMEGQNG